MAADASAPAVAADPRNDEVTYNNESALCKEAILIKVDHVCSSPEDNEEILGLFLSFPTPVRIALAHFQLRLQDPRNHVSA